MHQGTFSPDRSDSHQVTAPHLPASGSHGLARLRFRRAVSSSTEQGLRLWPLRREVLMPRLVPALGRLVQHEVYRLHLHVAGEGDHHAPKPIVLRIRENRLIGPWEGLGLVRPAGIAHLLRSVGPAGAKALNKTPVKDELPSKAFGPHFQHSTFSAVRVKDGFHSLVPKVCVDDLRALPSCRGLCRQRQLRWLLLDLLARRLSGRGLERFLLFGLQALALLDRVHEGAGHQRSHAHHGLHALHGFVALPLADVLDVGCARTGGKLHGHPALDDLLHVPVDVLMGTVLRICPGILLDRLFVGVGLQHDAAVGLHHVGLRGDLHRRGLVLADVLWCWQVGVDDAVPRLILRQVATSHLMARVECYHQASIALTCGVVVVKDIANVVVGIIPVNSPPNVLVGHELFPVEDAGILLPQGDQQPHEAHEIVLLFLRVTPRKPAARILAPAVVAAPLGTAILITIENHGRSGAHKQSHHKVPDLTAAEVIHAPITCVTFVATVP
mmetsp:Transcript_100335/g.239219  ORF Transcript_100335/g.239219 Transcript_100335/m.239219 type:complete len:498 (-) Transcript_100335:1614-3107(-)